jgi:hypothetical protein
MNRRLNQKLRCTHPVSPPMRRLHVHRHCQHFQHLRVSEQENGRAAVLVTASSFVCVKGEMSPPGATPPGKGEASGGSGGGSAGRGAARGGGNALSVIDFREDMFPAAVTLVFLLLGLLRGTPFPLCYPSHHSLPLLEHTHCCIRACAVLSGGLFYSRRLFIVAISNLCVARNVLPNAVSGLRCYCT